MKVHIAAIAAVMLVTLCAGPAQLDTGANAPENGGTPLTPPAQLPNCDLVIKMVSPQTNEALSGGFRVEWTVENAGGRDFTNKYLDFTIYMSSDSTSTDLRTIRRMYGDLYKEDLTFLQKIPSGTYSIGVRGSAESCYITPVHVPVRVL